MSLAVIDLDKYWPLEPKDPCDGPWPVPVPVEALDDVYDDDEDSPTYDNYVRQYQATVPS